MRKLLVKILQILDGTPAVYGKRQSGQSVVELALITPILIILLAGLVEIGWFANNYLTLLDVTRAGARRGAVLQDQKSPTFWDNKYSYVPNDMLTANCNDTQAFDLDCHLYWMTNGNVVMSDSTNADNGTDQERFVYRWMPPGSAEAGNTGSQPCNPTYTDRVFYNEVICTMITTMDPLSLNPSNGVDDIVVSGFSLQLIDQAYLPPGYDGDPSGSITGPEVEVVGRYPTNANECDVLQGAGGAPTLASRPGDENRDPFDLNGNNHVDVAAPSGTDAFSEITGYDPMPDTNSGDANYDANWEQDAEKQVGFSLFGNHKIDGTYCVGSEWTMSQVEKLMNLPDYDLSNTVGTDGKTQKSYIPSQGLVLVEMYWQHEMLLKIPVLSPVYTAVGNKDGKMVISVWAAFPLGTVEPHIEFP
jgi:Flp pilus assembly protein TadG